MHHVLPNVPDMLEKNVHKFIDTTFFDEIEDYDNERADNSRGSHCGDDDVEPFDNLCRGKVQDIHSGMTTMISSLKNYVFVIADASADNNSDADGSYLPPCPLRVSRSSIVGGLQSLRDVAGYWIKAFLRKATRISMMNWNLI